MNSQKFKQYDPKHEFKSKLRKGDEVLILAGKSRDEIGKIETLDKKTGRVFIAGKNLNKKHQKPSLNDQEGGIVDIPMSLHISKVALVDAKTKKATRLGYKLEGDKKVRFAKKSGAVV